MSKEKLVKFAYDVNLDIKKTNEWDSLDIYKFVSHLEKKTKISISDKDIENILKNKFKTLIKKIK